MGDAAARVTPRAALDRFFGHYYRMRPVQATFTGVHEYDTRLPDWSPEGLEASTAEMRGLRRMFDSCGRIEDDEVRAFPDDTDRALADGFLEIQLAEQASGHFLHRNPALWTGEAIFGVIALVTRPFAPIEARIDAAVARMRAIPAFLSDARRGVQAVPEPWRGRAIRECAAAVHLFGESLPRWWRSAALPPRCVAEADEAAFAASAAFRACGEWVERELPAAVPTEVSAGSELLALLLQRGHWCVTPTTELLREAREALDAEEASLDRQAHAHAPGGWPDVHERLAALHAPVEDYLPRFERVWSACREAAVAGDVVTWPEAPIRYVPIPEHTRDTAPDLYYLSYRSPAPFDRLPVHDYLVTPIDGTVAPDEQRRRLRGANDSVIKLNHVVHHGALGHHVQNACASASASRIGQVAAVDGASRIGMFSGGTLAEGWACYACDVMEEAGFLTTLESVAQQHTRVRLAARAVADLALHGGRIGLAEVEDLYRTRARMSSDAARAEAIKTSMFPGTAVMYWLGTRGLHRLRRACARREGAAFRLRRFHDEVLRHGAIPVPLIARLMTSGGGD